MHTVVMEHSSIGVFTPLPHTHTCIYVWSIKLSHNLIIYPPLPLSIVSCTNMEESIVSLMIDCEVSSVFDFTTLCSYDNQLAQPCMFQYIHTCVIST